MSYTNFKDNFSTGMSFLKKKISETSLLEGENVAQPHPSTQQPPSQPQNLQQQPRPPQQIPRQQPSPQQQHFQHQPSLQQPPPRPPVIPQRQQSQPTHEHASPSKMQFGGPNYPQQISQQSSQNMPQQPTHQRFMPASMSGTVQNMVKAASQAVSHASEAIKTVPHRKNAKILLIIDEPNTEWNRLFYGRKLNEEVDVQVEQAEFSELHLRATSAGEMVVEIKKNKNESHKRSFRPDFVLVRQHVRDATSDYKSIILGLNYARIPSINSLHSLYNFLDKPWVFAHLVKIQQRLGRLDFPLIRQCYYPNFKEMLVAPQFPAVVKVGHAHGGSGKIKVDTHYAFQDIASATALTNTYSTSEPLVESLYDIFIQKIGNNYKAFMRRSLSDSWKADTGSVVLEQVAMNEKYKMWADECSRMFGGLDMLSIQVVQTRDDQQFIIEVNDSTMSLLGSSQLEDYKLVVDLVINKMKASCLKPGLEEQSSMSSNEYMQRNPYEGVQRAPLIPARSQPYQRPNMEETDDTMQNFKKTFAGIFSNM